MLVQIVQASNGQQLFEEEKDFRLNLLHIINMLTIDKK